MNLGIFPHLDAVLLSSAVLIAADRVPTFNLEPVCREVAHRADAPHYKDTCLREEYEAREQLKKRWTAFPASDRAYCAQLGSLGGVPSYVELLTCLDVAREARRVREEEARAHAKRSAL